MNRILHRSAAALLALALAAAAPAAAPQHFATPEQATDALVAAVRAGNRPALVKLFGSQSASLIGSVEAIEYAEAASRFLRAYDEKHALAEQGDARVLSVGNDGWQFPVPLRRDADGWSFDGPAGRQEILARRIGMNELAAQQVCRAIADAEAEYASTPRDGRSVRAYASRLTSTPGRQNGLYWPAKPGETESPLGPLAAQAQAPANGKATKQDEQPRPYHGYFFRILTAQGPSAPGGTVNWMAKDSLIGGFAVLAFPAEYGVTGVKTYLLGYDGVLYERDLGKDTSKITRGMRAFEPDRNWKKVAPTA